jgi:hypothetical protein
MYLKQLYKQHKGWFLFVLLFIVGQLFINFKRGVVFSPFYHYGMYSERMELKDSVAIAQITINNKKLQPFEYSAQEWDKLVLPIYLDSTVHSHNRTVFSQDAERLLKKLRLQPKEKFFEVEWHCYIDFMDWYKPYASKIIGDSINSISINQYACTLNDIKQKAAKK